MKFKITIDTGNAAFEDDVSCEIVRILKTLVFSFENYSVDILTPRNLFDINGNRVGTAELVE